jgi:hypothetical protein
VIYAVVRFYLRDAPRRRFRRERREESGAVDAGAARGRGRRPRRERAAAIEHANGECSMGKRWARRSVAIAPAPTAAPDIGSAQMRLTGGGGRVSPGAGHTCRLLRGAMLAGGPGLVCLTVKNYDGSPAE